MATEYLNAIDNGGTVVSGGQGLVDRINARHPAAGARVDETYRTTVGSSDATGYVIAYEGSAVRNTTVNNIAYGAGFISNTTTADQLAIERRFRNGRAAAAPSSAGTGNS